MGLLSVFGPEKLAGMDSGGRGAGAIFGEGIVHWPTVFSLMAFPIIVWIYFRLARKEEQQMIEAFGEDYQSYRRAKPMFLPSPNDIRQLFRAIQQPNSHDKE